MLSEAGYTYTGFRPNFDELAALFPNTTIVNKIIIEFGTHLQNLIKRPFSLLRVMLRLCMPFYKPKSWLIVLNYFRWSFKSFKNIGMVLHKVANKG